jgi:hypothetical protein
LPHTKTPIIQADQVIGELAKALKATSFEMDIDNTQQISLYHLTASTNTNSPSSTTV